MKYSEGGKMMNKYLKMISVPISVCLLFSLAACAKTAGTENNNSTVVSTSEAITTEKATEATKERQKLTALIMSGDESRQKIADKLENDLVAGLPDFDVEVTRGGGADDYNNKLKTLNATGELPDVFWLSGTPE
jgi:hypothetical protein